MRRSVNANPSRDVGHKVNTNLAYILRLLMRFLRPPELLVDVTSHELRQPVSAILNCSALVRSNLWELRQDLDHCLTEKIPFEPSEALISVIDEDLEVRIRNPP